MNKAQISTKSCKYTCDPEKLCPELLPANCDDFYERRCDCVSYCKKMVKFVTQFVTNKDQI